jgi:hypothetical protein
MPRRAAPFQGSSTPRSPLRRPSNAESPVKTAGAALTAETLFNRSAGEIRSGSLARVGFVPASGREMCIHTPA